MSFGKYRLNSGRDDQDIDLNVLREACLNNNQSETTRRATDQALSDYQIENIILYNYHIEENTNLIRDIDSLLSIPHV